MGSYGDKDLWCHWCWKSGSCQDELPDGVIPLWDVDGVGLLCDVCMQLEEPPWWPNNRQRCALQLRESIGRLLPLSAVKKVADFLVSNDS